MCNGGSTGTATITATGGTAPYTGTGTFTGLAAGTTSYTVTDANGCTSVVSVTITEPAVLVAAGTHTNVLCNGGSTGTATITATGGTAPYTGTGTFTGLATGTHSYTVTDFNGCTSTVSVTITEPTVLVASATASTIACFGGTATVTITATGGTGAYSYTFDGVTNTTGVFTHAAGTNLAYSVTDANGCSPATANGTITIVQSAILNATVTSTNAVCAGNYNSATITISSPTGGSGTYQYSIDGGATWQNSGSYNVNAGTYNVQIRDAGNTSCVRVLNPALVITEASNTDVTIGSQTADNLYATNGVEKTIAYNLTEINGKAATPAVIRVFKPAGYLVLFNPALTTWVDVNGFPGPITYTVDNTKWVQTASTTSYVEFTRTGGANTINCNEQLRVVFSLKRNTLNKTKFNLNVQFRPATGEVKLNNNTNSIIFIGE